MSTTLTVNVMDSDDQDPKFTEETYTAKVSRFFGSSVSVMHYCPNLSQVISGLVSAGLEVHPEKIRAEDQVNWLLGMTNAASFALTALV